MLWESLVQLWLAARPSSCGNAGGRSCSPAEGHFGGALVLAEATCQVWWGENYFMGALFLDEAACGCGWMGAVLEGAPVLAEPLASCG